MASTTEEETEITTPYIAAQETEIPDGATTQEEDHKDFSM